MSRKDALLPIRFVTYNIRVKTTDLQPNEKPWDERKSYIIKQLNFVTFYNPEAIIGLQEAKYEQIIDVLTGLDTHSSSSSGKAEGEEEDWTYIGQGREGGTSDEHCPILFRKTVWEAEHTETRWYTDTYDRPSKDPNASHKRILTIGILRHRQTNTRILAMNTHFEHDDDGGRTARWNAANYILQWVPQWLSSYDDIRGLFLSGDFNTNARGLDDAYGVLLGSNCFDDSREVIGEGNRYGHDKTWSDYTGNPRDYMLLDYILFGPRKEEGGSGTGNDDIPWRIRIYGVLENRFDDGVFSSDHRAVVVDAELEL